MFSHSRAEGIRALFTESWIAFHRKYFLLRARHSTGPLFWVFHSDVHTHRRKEKLFLIFPFAPSFKTFLRLLRKYTGGIIFIYLSIFFFSLLPIDIFSNFTLPAFLFTFLHKCLNGLSRTRFLNEKVSRFLLGWHKIILLLIRRHMWRANLF